MLRFILILTFILQPIVGFGAGAGVRMNETSVLDQSFSDSLCTMSSMQMKSDRSCCHSEMHISDKVQSIQSPPCGCAIGSQPINDSIPAPVRYPVERPTDLRLMSFFSLVSATPFSVIDLSLLGQCGLRFTDDDRISRDQSDLDVLSILCIRLI